MKLILARPWLLAALLASLGLGCAAPAAAQAVYKCGRARYSQAPCAPRTVDTRQAPVTAAGGHDQAIGLRRLPGEDAQAFALRRRRGRLAPADRDECARLDARIAAEASLDNARYAAQRAQTQETLRESRSRAARLGC
ncbi:MULTISPECIES: hypothetical protein [Ramlibacter]|uniref:DUF4124 domain-containing protein n=1 Tax=Ramlibacter aquaticus TaxID=2780094 RepID=A0ABR9S9T2_9BURK|nr:MULTISPECIES: hypothetical protein [Ramlibacter]MBE7938984.1 hypothetical protein [Ramlibacter aquaticus]